MLPLLVFASAPAEPTRPFSIELEQAEVDGHRVVDPSASGKLTLAVSLTSAVGTVAIDAGDQTFPPGRYRAVLRVRSPRLNETAMVGTPVALSAQSGGRTLCTIGCDRFSFSSPQKYEGLPLSFLLRRKGRVRFAFSWSRDAEVSAEAASETAPTAPGKEADGGKDAAGGMEAGVMELELDEVDFPCLLADRLTIERVGEEILIDRVWPQKVHCAPGEENPIEVRLLNVSAVPREVRVRATMVSGVSDRFVIGERVVTVDAEEESVLNFEWTATAREYGHQVTAELLDGDRLLERATEYFGVSRNIWQVSIQSPGFIEWVPQERKVEGNVRNERRAYMNVSEAFSWAPCSFTDLTPDTDEWWSGQNNYHNHLRILRNWMSLAHANGMKMITYSFPTACGAVGMEFARQYPDWVTNWGIGLGISFTVRDLRWRRWARERGKPFLATVSRQWHSGGIDRGHLGAIDFGAREIVRSAKALGWDGVRFDGIWRWSALGGAGVQRQFESMGIEAEAKNLFPDLYGKEEQWTSDEVSYRNMKWGKYRMLQELPTFALSYNFGIAHAQSGAKTPRAFAEACAGGGQIMNERLRQYRGRWDDYARFIMSEADIVRELGGHFVMCGLDGEGGTELDRIYMKIFTLAGRAHPYLHTYQWGKSPTGKYSQFATRYSELLWHPDWRAIENGEEVFEVTSTVPIWWKWHATWRETEDGPQVLVHLITAPPTEKPWQSPDALPPRQRDVRLAFKGFRGRKRIAAAHAFTAEPHTRSLPVGTEQTAAGTTITIPEHHYWTVALIQLDRAR